MTAAVAPQIGGEPQTYVSADRSARARASCPHALRNDARPGARRPRSSGRCSTASRPTAACTCPSRSTAWTPDEIARAAVAARWPRSASACSGRTPPARSTTATLDGDRRRGAELSDSARRGRAGRLRARAVSRPDARVQGRRRARDGAADGGAARRRARRPRCSWRRPATPAAPSRTRSTACRTRASSSCIPTAA